MSPHEVDKMLKGVMLKDLRIQCRARGLSPAGGKEQLADRLKEHMLETGDL
jgi:SPIRAL1-like protein